MQKITARRRYLLLCSSFLDPVHYSASPPPILKSFELLQCDILSALPQSIC